MGTIQVRIYDDRIEVWNPGHLPSDLTLDQLYHRHASHPGNPLIAQAFYRARLIEHWGTGTVRIIAACKKANIKVGFEATMGSFIVTLRKRAPDREEIPTQSPTQSPTQLGKPIDKILSMLQTRELSSAELRIVLGLRHRPTFRQNYLHPALASGLIAQTVPDKPNSRLQKYRITKKGLAYLKKAAR